MADGVVSFEAESFHSNVAAGGHAWATVSNGVYSGGLAMQAMPNVGTNRNTGYVAASPMLAFVVNFNRSGLHAIAVRGVGLTGSDDSVHAGLNGVGVSTSDRIYNFVATPLWSMQTLDGPIATFVVPSAGPHTVNIWMREDGFIVDKIVVTSNTNFLPEGLGPPESARAGGAGASTDPMSTSITGITLSNGAIVATFDPVPGADAYTVCQGTNLAEGLASNALATVDSLSIQAPLDGSPMGYIGVDAHPLPTNRELASLVLNRLAYGPTPDELDRVLTGPAAIGADAYIAEQLAPELIAETIDGDPAVAYLTNLLQARQAGLADLQAWFILRALGAKRQLLETLLQFFDNHFNTYYWKSQWTLDELGLSSSEASQAAADLEYREIQGWRQALLDPNATFLDLLRISAESPAMIIYLDTIENIASAPNENYSREIQELFCMGVDNGYDQDDIVAMAKVWTGWKVAQVAPGDAANPHATPTTNEIVLLPAGGSGWLYRKGTNAPPAAWKDPGFALDASWLSGTAAIGYGRTNAVTVLSDMSNNYSTVYFRKEFAVTNVAEAAQARLRMLVDDGCVMYLNGQEILRYNVPAGPLVFSNLAASGIGTPAWQTAAATGLASNLVAGTNVLAVHCLNVTRRSPDFLFDAQLSVPPVWSFVFDPAAHDPAAKVIYSNKTVAARFGAPYAGQPYPLSLPARAGTNGIQDGYDAIAHIADLPYTREFICVKLCQLLVNEDFRLGEYYNIANITPEAALVRDCMAAWATPGPDGRKGNIRSVLSVILQSSLFRGQRAAQHKIRTPFEYTVAAVRALRADLGGGAFTAGTDGYDLVGPMWYAGMELFARPEPDGWPERGRNWIDTSTVSERMRFVENLLMATNDPLKSVDYGSGGAQNVADPVALLMSRLPAGEWTDAAAVADFFLRLLFPGEGAANLDMDRAACVDALNSDDGGVPGTSPFSSLTPGGAAYDARVRSAVGLLLSNPRFHEQ